jgi:alkyl hydroperoxide reductase subunit D
MSALEGIRAALPEAARDIKLNLQTVLQEGTLTPAQRWGVAVASAAASRNGRLRDAVLTDARAVVEEAVLEDGLAAAVLMGMNNVYYRFRHLVDKPSYAQMPARLRMNRIAKPATSRTDFELFCLAVSAVNGCQTCIQSHEKVVLDGGLTEEQVHEAVRIAAVMEAAAIGLEIAEASPRLHEPELAIV